MTLCLPTMPTVTKKQEKLLWIKTIGSIGASCLHEKKGGRFMIVEASAAF